MSAVQAVGGGKCTLQSQGNVVLGQFLERTATGRSFSVDAQSSRIIGQAPVAQASGYSPRITAHPTDLASTRFKQVSQVRDEPHGPQQSECADLRFGKRFAHASRRG